MPKINCRPFIFLSVLIFTLLFVFQSFAASLTLDKIGALDTSGKKYSQWWYTVANPTLLGKASDSQKVKVTIDSKSSETKADSAGNWMLSTTMPNGDHSISIVSGSETYSFKLTIGTTMPDFTNKSSTQSTVSVPKTGSHQIYFIIVSLYLAVVGFYFYRRNFVKTKFEKDILS